MANIKRWHLEIRDNETGEVKCNADVSILIFAAKVGRELHRASLCNDSKENMKITMMGLMEELEFSAKKMLES